MEIPGDSPRRPPLRANTAPLPLLALDPAHGPHTVHNSNIFFMNSRSHTQPQQTPLYPDTPLLSRYPTEPIPLPPSRPEFRRSSTTPPPPPLPPKPTEYSRNPQPLPLPPLRAPPPLPPTPDPPSNVPPAIPREEEDLAFALALSQSESAKQLIEQQRLALQEEEDLARALAESMNPTGVSHFPHQDSSGQRGSNFASTSKLGLKISYEHLSSNSSLRHTKEDLDSDLPYVSDTPTSASLPKELDVPRRWDALASRDRALSMDRAATRPVIDSMMPGGHLDEKETPVWNDDTSLELPEYTPRINVPPQIPSPTSSPQVHRGTNGAYERQLEADDEAFARQLAAQQDEEDFSHSQPTLQTEAISYPNLNSPQSSLSRTQQPSSAFNYPRAFSSNAQQDQVSNPPVNVHVSLSVTNQIMYPIPFSSSSSTSQADVPTLLVEPPLNISRRSSFGSPDTPNLVYSHSLPTGSSVSLDTSQTSTSRADLDRSSSTASNQSSRSGPTSLGAPMTPSPNPSVINMNHFIDTEQLLGVSIGFVPPALTEQLLPMQDSMPNIVSLPYGRCPPLHFQGQSWRHLLRLMARLSGSRIEPTVEAVAVSKSELQLRTVVQFVKPTPGSREWRTILWFALEHPVPPTMSGAHRYMGNNVTVLPWSFMMTPVPKLLLDGVDTGISKTFTIPTSDAVPYPKLPITFPNLAMYLQAALDESRRHLNDNSTQLRKLAKMMQQCYPSTDEGLPDGPEKSSSVGGLFKRVIGRSNKQNKKRGGGNEDTYELVTPFVPDEWGA